MFDLTYLHPMVVHFPIALILVGFLAEVVGIIAKKDFFNKMAFYLLALGSLAIIVTYISGEAAGGGIEESGTLKDAIEKHQDAARIAMILTLVTFIFRSILLYTKKYTGYLKIIAAVIFLISTLAIARAASFGGDLVYKHGAGVEVSTGISKPNITPDK